MRTTRPNVHLRPSYVRGRQRDIPSSREFHVRGIRLEVLDKANTYDVPLAVLEKETDTLKSTCVTSPAPGTGYTAWELLRSISIRHATSKLKLCV